MTKVYDIQRSKLRWLMALVMLFSLVPSALLLTVGVLVLVLGHATKDVVFGVLILGLASTLLGGVVATVLYVRRETTVARLQTEFVSKVSHDLRTPLTSIRLFVETLQEGRLRDPDKVQQALDVIAMETSRLSAMINRLLGWARMEAGRRIYRMELESPHRVVEAALAAFEPQRLTADVTLEKQVEPDLPLVRIDLHAMSEALLNLLQNAFHYTGPQKHIRVSCRRYGKQVAIAVADNGPGIAKKDQKRIFEKFYRVARDDAPLQVQGSGLGLAMVHHIVRAHGGLTRVESELGRGATFTIYLPAAAPAEGR
ncbi:MAG: HAMP domain-containing sensor histidine kinase [Myxococcales bacterium]|nr:HAMP domain-containing sensor histidine kinase [Myxococcales bacterium]